MTTQQLTELRDCEVAGQVSLAAGAGARRLAEARCRAAVQLLLVQACGEVYVSHAPRLPQVTLATAA